MKHDLFDGAGDPATILAGLRATAAANQNWALFDFYTPRLAEAGGDITAGIPAEVIEEAHDRLDAVMQVSAENVDSQRFDWMTVIVDGVADGVLEMATMDALP